MRARQLETSSALVRATQADQLGVSLTRNVGQIFSEPLTGGLIAREFDRAQANFEAIGIDEREQFREAERARQARRVELEFELNYTTDEIARQNIISELDELYQDKNTQRDAIIDRAIEDGRLLTPEAVNEEYGFEIDRPMSRAEADIIRQGRREQEIRNAIIQAGPRGIAPSAIRLGASILNFATDPVELGSMFIPIVGPAGRAASVARFGRVGGRAVEGAIEGGVGSLLTEPLYFGLTQSQQLDYSMQDALFNIGAGVFLGGGIGTVVGAFSRTPVNMAEVRAASEPELQVISGERIDPVNELQLGEQFYDDPARAVGIDELDAIAYQATDSAARRNLRENIYGFIGGKLPFEDAIRRLANDRGVSVELTAPRAVSRPPTLSDFIRRNGGINDSDPTFRGELENIGFRTFEPYKSSKGNQVNGIINPRAERNLDDMAELAQEAGYIVNRDTNELVDALRNESRGDFVFARRDMQQADLWRQYHEGMNDLDAEIDRRDNIRRELEAIGYRDATDDEIAVLSSEMAFGKTLDQAAKSIGIQAEGLRASAIARDMANPYNDPLSDFDASMRADMLPEDFDWEQATNRELEILRQMEVDGTLTAEQRALADEIAQIDERADSYIQAVQAAAVCVTRT